MRTANGQFWPAEDDAKLMAACGGRAVVGEAGWRAIAERMSLPRTWQSCRQRAGYLHRKATGTAPKPRKPRERKVNGRIFRSREGMQDPPAPGSIPQPASITAALFGDPLPGRSALDKRPQADTGTTKLMSDLPRRTPVDQMRAGLA